jgi:two-component system phosphate regulon sensor histidine kinase PhoR
MHLTTGNASHKTMHLLTIKAIIFIIAISLVGLVVTQSFWFREEIVLEQKQYDHRVDNALMDVLNELRNKPGNKRPLSSQDTTYMSFINRKNILDAIDTTLLRSLMKKYVEYHMLDRNYYYEIVRTSNDSVIFRSSATVALKGNVKPYKACLPSIWGKENHHLALYFPGRKKAFLPETGLWLGLAFIFLIILVSGFAYIIFYYLRQKKLSEMKNDFINNITHEFKTPISTISLATEVLMKNDPKLPSDRIRKYAKIIYDENERMRTQVERVLQMAQQDHQEIRLYPEEIDIHDMLNTIVHNMCHEKGDAGIRINYRLKATRHIIKADKVFVSGIITNITDNAIKYAIRDPEITIETADHLGGIMISIMDNGPGISRDAQKYVFEKFYRVPTGNVHNVKGFGLGLYYARVMTEAHGGRISVNSEVNKGSRFDVYLPGPVKKSFKTANDGKTKRKDTAG